MWIAYATYVTYIYSFSITVVNMYKICTVMFTGDELRKKILNYIQCTKHRWREEGLGDASIFNDLISSNVIPVKEYNTVYEPIMRVL